VDPTKLSRVKVSLALMMALSVPWLNPFSTGPSASTVQSLLTGLCLATLLFVWMQQEDGLDGLAAGSWLAVGLASCAMGLLQYFDLVATLKPWINGASIGEAFANLRQRNQFATLTNIGMVALIWFGLTQPFRLSKAQTDAAGEIIGNSWLLALFVAIATLLAAGNAASSSRTGLAQLVLVGLMSWGWRQARNPRVCIVLIAAAVTYAVSAFALPRLIGLDPASHGIAARLQDGGPACASRLTLWSNVLHLIAQKPWAGWGWGELDYAHFITLYPGPRFCEILDNAHNLPLHLAVELGLPVATLICGVAGWLVLRAKPWRETDATRQMAWAVLALIMLHSMLEYPLWYGPFQMTFALCVWLLWREPRAAHLPSARSMAVVAASVLMAATSYAAWDYYRISQIYLAPEERSETYRDNTLEKLKASWLFRDQVRFAELTTAELTPDNAVQINTLAKEVTHFSPEARVVQKVIESAVMLGHSDEALFFIQRFKAAYPQDYEQWAAANTSSPGLKSP